MVPWKVGTSARSAGAAEQRAKIMILDSRVGCDCKRQHLNARSRICPGGVPNADSGLGRGFP